ncbi:MAG: hypothetical protein Q4D41_12810 [Prevotellaceae bacterium]|nr:hypothetical protein [Prevotellaceae bacterium]
MKKFINYALFMSLLIFAIGSFIACSDDDDDDGDKGDVAQMVLGKWVVTMSDPTWKVNLTLGEDGTFSEADYYDIDGDKTFTEYDGTYRGTYIVSEKGITFNPIDDSALLGETYYWEEVSSSSFVASDGDGFYIYGTRN